MDVVHRADLAGVAAFWSEMPPPARVALVFGVGHADEPLPNHGVTHLVEHLALMSLGQNAYQYNGFVSPLTTVLHAQGRVEDVQAFIREVTGALSSLPISSRLDDEKRVLRAEEARGFGSWASHLSRRYGSLGPGIIDYPQFGLRRLREEHVTAWVAERFVVENCALWASFDPTGVIDPHLPGGRAHRGAEPVDLEAPAAARVFHKAGGIGMTMSAPRSHELAAASRLLQARLFERLRRSMAAAYQPRVTYEPVGPETAHILVASDCAPADAGPVANAMLEEVRRLRDEGPSQAEIEAEVERLRVAHMDPNSALGSLHRSAAAHALGVDDLGEDVVEAVARMTPADISGAVRTAYGRALMFVPEGLGGDVMALPIAREWSKSVVDGRWLTRRATFPGGAPHRSRLKLGEDGLTMAVAPTMNNVTVRFGETTAVLGWCRGDRRLVGADGFSLPIRGGEWDEEETVRARIDERVPPDLFVSMDEPTVDPEEVARRCEVCGCHPAAEVTIATLRPTASWRRRRFRMCRDCGRSGARHATVQALGPQPRLLLAWVSALGLAVHNVWPALRLRRLAKPQRAPDSIYWRPGKPAWAYPRAYLGLACCLAVLAGLFGLALYVRGLASATTQPDFVTPTLAPPPTLDTFPPGVLPSP